MNNYEQQVVNHFNSINVYGTFISVEQTRETKNIVYVLLVSKVTLPTGHTKRLKHRYK